MRSSVGALACALLVMAAGCGSDDSSDVSDPSNASVPSNASDTARTAPSLQAATATWTLVAQEWQPFALASPSTVRYGASDSWVERTLPAGQASCTNQFFGVDPLPYVVKRCEVARASASSGAWVFVAGEWASFSLTSPRRMRYGAEAAWIERDVAAGDAPCTTAFFGGDPLPGVVKSCEFWEEGAVPSAGEGWAFVADEWQTFTLPAPGRVRYGAGTTWVERDLGAGAASCSSLFFGGDPLPGVVKRCEVLASSTSGTSGTSGTSDGCGGALSLSAPPPDALNAREFGAVGDGRSDDTAALQRALDTLRPGQWLVFPPGVYVHSARLNVTTPDVVIDGRGATLHATNPYDQAVMIQASGVRVHGFVMTAVTDTRQSAAWQSRIAVWRHGVGLAPLERVAIVANRIVEGGGPGTPLANSASSAGIFVHNARDFLVAGNTVRRSLADGIQITGGSRRGQVVFNTVRETGDDMIGVVSYVSETEAYPAPAQTALSLGALRDGNLAQDILIADNDLAGQYWGRGIAVVGAEQVGIWRNTIDATTHAAGIYLAREHGFGTFGVRDVRVESNRITRVQVTDAAYLPASMNWARGARTGHGAIELVAHQYDDETAQPVLRSELVVRRVRIAGNRIEQALAEGVRVGYGYDQHDVDFSRGFPRGFDGATVSEVVVEGNTVAAAYDALGVANRSDPALVLSCSGNSFDGRAYSNAACGSAAIGVSGSSKTSCSWPN